MDLPQLLGTGPLSCLDACERVVYKAFCEQPDLTITVGKKDDN